VEEGGGAAGVAGAALRLEIGGGGAGIGEGLAAAKLRRFGGVAWAEAGEPLAEAGGAEAGDGDAWVEAADGLIHPYSRANKLTLSRWGSIYQGQQDCAIAELNSYLRGLILCSSFFFPKRKSCDVGERQDESGMEDSCVVVFYRLRTYSSPVVMYCCCLGC
jgi:hypothetical protein